MLQINYATNVTTDSRHWCWTFCLLCC